MYQDQGLKGIVAEPLFLENPYLHTNDLSSLSSINNTNLKIGQFITNQNRHSNINKQNKFTYLGKAKDLFTNQFIQYKFNKSNADSNNLNLV
jgi:hypothetical protein